MWITWLISFKTLGLLPDWKLIGIKGWHIGAANEFVQVGWRNSSGSGL